MPSRRAVLIGLALFLLTLGAGAVSLLLTPIHIPVDFGVGPRVQFTGAGCHPEIICIPLSGSYLAWGGLMLALGWPAALLSPLIVALLAARGAGSARLVEGWLAALFGLVPGLAASGFNLLLFMAWSPGESSPPIWPLALPVGWLLTTLAIAVCLWAVSVMAASMGARRYGAPALIVLSLGSAFLAACIGLVLLDLRPVYPQTITVDAGQAILCAAVLLVYAAAPLLLAIGVKRRDTVYRGNQAPD